LLARLALTWHPSIGAKQLVADVRKMHEYAFAVFRIELSRKLSAVVRATVRLWEVVEDHSPATSLTASFACNARRHEKGLIAKLAVVRYPNAVLVLFRVV
jgi:hypothetical protein